MGSCFSVKTHVLGDGSIFEGKGNTNGGYVDNGSGIIYYTDGSTFEGTIKRGRKEGNGIYTQNEEFQYSGDWVNDTYHGKGIWKTAQPGETQIQQYVGDFRNGIMTGSAVISYSNGCVYRGKVVNGHRSGQGTLENDHHIMYNGNWANNKYHGYGTRYYEGGESYIGYFKHGKRNGRGTYSSTHIDNKLDADWVNDVPQGIYSGDLPTTKLFMEDEGVYKTHKIRECVICMDHEPDLVYLPCRHCCVCSRCPRQNECPLCRNAIFDTIEPIYC